MYDYQLHAESHSCLSDRREGESDLANDSIPPVGGWASSRSDRHLLPTLSLSHTHAHTHTHTHTHAHRHTPHAHAHAHARTHTTFTAAPFQLLVFVNDCMSSLPVFRLILKNAIKPKRLRAADERDYLSPCELLHW